MTEEPGSPDVSIIVCTRNRVDDLALHFSTVVASARASSVPTEVIVVDNGSTDGTADFLASRFPSVRVVAAPEAGVAAARNAGVRAADGKVVVFTDDDVQVPLDWAQRMSAPLLEGRAEVCVGGIQAADELRRPWVSTWVLQNLAHYPTQKDIDPDVVTANAGALRALLETVPFDERLGRPPYKRAEDAFFGVQAREVGARIVGVAGDPVIHHFDPRRLERVSLYRLVRSGGRSSAYVWYHWAHGRAPHLLVKSIVARIEFALRLPWLRRHPSDRDLQLAAKIAMLGELRRIEGMPRHYPAPAERRRAGWSHGRAEDAEGR
ncbi:hypothetical protein GCM10009775_10220 [Microbacterium aoyamense]|uniref:Glycosyltransferase 2-like domain-containing protein n=1 Tax=Microbacterium aoyamense TaxID=344166 RepID=A0ABN2PEC1_9MICO|nr:glycosyltransferase family 2 protein [Microbacterium aoyamense]